MIPGLILVPLNIRSQNIINIGAVYSTIKTTPTDTLSIAFRNIKGETTVEAIPYPISDGISFFVSFILSL